MYRFYCYKLCLIKICTRSDTKVWDVVFLFVFFRLLFSFCSSLGFVDFLDELRRQSTSIFRVMEKKKKKRKRKKESSYIRDRIRSIIIRRRIRDYVKRTRRISLSIKWVLREQLTIRLQQNCFQVAVILGSYTQSCTKTEIVSQILTGDGMPFPGNNHLWRLCSANNKPVYIGLHWFTCRDMINRELESNELVRIIQ